MTVSAARPSTRAVAAQRTRTALLDSAAVLFSRDGYELTSVRAVATNAGLTIGAVYAHFGSKREMLYALLRRTLESGPSSRPAGRLSRAQRARHRLVLTVASFAHEDERARDLLAYALENLHPRTIGTPSPGKPSPDAAGTGPQDTAATRRAAVADLLLEAAGWPETFNPGAAPATHTTDR